MYITHSVCVVLANLVENFISHMEKNQAPICLHGCKIINGSPGCEVSIHLNPRLHCPAFCAVYTEIETLVQDSAIGACIHVCYFGSVIVQSPFSHLFQGSLLPWW